MRRTIYVTLLVMLLMAPMGAGFAAGPDDMTALEKIAAIEKVFYGSEQTGAILERINKLEKDTFGVSTDRALLSRIDWLYSYTKHNSPTSASLVTKLNAVEWTFSHSVTQGPAKNRIEQMEKTLLGSIAVGSFDKRLNTLTKLAYNEGTVEVTSVTIPKDTLVKIKTLSTLDSNKSRPGDNVLFRVVDDVYSGNILVIPKGAYGYGKVKTVEPKRNFGRDAKLEVDFNIVEAIDSSTVKTLLGDKAKEQTRSMAMAAGASVAGIALLGPVGIVGGIFVHGQDIVIQPGTEMYIQVAMDTQVYGVKAK